MMHFEYDRDQKMYQKTAREFLAKECQMEQVREILNTDIGYSPALWKKIAELDWLRMLIHEQYDGAGCDFIDVCPILEEVGRALFPSPYFPTAIMGAGLISEVAGEELQQKILPGIGNGDIIVTLAADQTGNGCDAAGVKYMAEKQGDGYIINGIQSFVPFAGASNYIICCAEVNGLNSTDATLFLLDSKSEGITCTPMPSFSIDKYYQVSLKGVKVSDDHVIGTPGQGCQAIDALWPKIIAGVCIMMVGGLQRVLELTVDYVKKRKQFGIPIGSFQAIQFYCADMAMDVESSKFIAYQAAWKISNHLASKIDVSIAKAWCGDAFQRVTALAHQSHGAIGFTEEYDLHFYYKQAKSLQLMYGGSPFHRQIVADEMDLIKVESSGLT